MESEPEKWYKRPSEKSYACRLCSKMFKCNTYLQDHLRSHSGEKPFLCSFCYKPFNLKSNCMRHIKKYCPFSKRKFNSVIKIEM